MKKRGSKVTTVLVTRNKNIDSSIYHLTFKRQAKNASDVYKNNPNDLDSSVGKISNLLGKNGNEIRNLFWMDVFQTILDTSVFAVNVLFFQKLLQGKYKIDTIQWDKNQTVT